MDVGFVRAGRCGRGGGVSLPISNRTQPVELTGEQKAKLLELVAADRKIGTVAAAREAGVEGSRARIREAIQADDDLVAQLEEARGRGPETIREEIRRRAIDGVEEPVFHNGDVVGSVTKYSDRMLAMMAKANLPEYRDETDVNIHVGGADGGPIEVEGRAVVGLAAVNELAARLGLGALVGLDAGAARHALPAAQDVLPDPPDS